MAVLPAATAHDTTGIAVASIAPATLMMVVETSLWTVLGNPRPRKTPPSAATRPAPIIVPTIDDELTAVLDRRFGHEAD